MSLSYLVFKTTLKHEEDQIRYKFTCLQIDLDGMEGCKHKTHILSQPKDSVNHSSYSTSTVARLPRVLCESVLQLRSGSACAVSETLHHRKMRLDVVGRFVCGVRKKTFGGAESGPSVSVDGRKEAAHTIQNICMHKEHLPSGSV